MTAMAPLVHLVDNDPHVLKALGRLLALEGIDTVASGSPQEFLSRYDPAVPGCVVLDLVMPNGGGLALQEELHRHGFPVPLVFLSGRADVPDSVRAMKGGAVDFLTKPVDSDIFVDAVRRALACDVEQRTSMEEADADRAALGTLTPREREILPYLVSGKLNKQIAADLGVAEKTVKVHRTHVMGKLGAPSRADLVRLVDRLHIAPIPCVGRTGN
jgi:FixJ family two-component response regulator